MKLSALFLLTLLLTCVVCRAQTKPVVIEKVDSLMLVEKKPILVLLTAPWCKYCLLQKSRLSKNRYFAEQAEKVYYTELDAESSRQTIRFNSKVYTYKNSGSVTGVHDLAEALNGSPALSYPTWVILNENYELLGRYNGVLSDGQLRTLFGLLQMIRKN